MYPVPCTDVVRSFELRCRPRHYRSAEEAKRAREIAVAVAAETEAKARARREEAWAIAARLAEAEAAAEEAAAEEAQAAVAAARARDELIARARESEVVARARRAEAARLADELAAVEMASDRARAEEMERIRILEATEMAKKNRAMDTRMARQTLADKYEGLQMMVAGDNAGGTDAVVKVPVTAAAKGDASEKPFRLGGLSIFG